MARKCKQCKDEIATVKASKDIIGKKGYCSIECMGKHGLSKAREAAAKRERKEHKARKEKLKTRADYAREAQAVFNQFIRFRDHDKPCISCNRHHQGQYHAGHYRTVGGNPELRFEELNCHKQCSVCNNHKSGNIVEYRINLIGRIGSGSLDWLEGPHEAKKYTIDELKQIKQEYKAKANQLKAVLDGK